MKRRPLLAFTVLWVIGSSAACMYSGWRLAGIVAGAWLLLLAVCRWNRAGAAMTLCMSLSLSGSAVYWEWHDTNNVSDIRVVSLEAGEADSVPIIATGAIASAVDIDGDRADFTVRLTSAELGGNALGPEEVGADDGSTIETDDIVMVQVRLLEAEERDIAAGWKRGDTVRLRGELQQPGIARNFDGFDYRRYLRTQKIHWIVKVKGAEQAEVKAPEKWRPGHILRWNDAVRQALGGKLEQLYGGIHAGYMKGLVIGYQDDLDPDTFTAFSRLGLTHILAISGMHVAVVVGCLLFLFNLLRLTRETSLTVVMWLIPVYVLLTGASPSIIRAGMMGMIGLYAAKKGLLKDGLHILSAAALVMLAWNPYFLLNVSFQLSFIVTAGLMIFVPKLMPLLSGLPRWFAGTAGITLVAQWVSFPLTIYYFNQFSLISVVANLLLVPVISLIVLPLGMISLILGWIWMKGAAWIAGWAEWLNELTFRFVGWMNGSAMMTIWPSPSLLWILIYFFLLYSLLHLLHWRAESIKARNRPSDDTVPLEEAGTAAIPGSNDPLRLSAMLPVISQLAGLLRRKGYVRSGEHVERFGANAAGAVLAGALGLQLFAGYHPPPLNGAGLVQFLDVGQGDSILVTTPEGKHILVDAGGTLNFRKEADAWKERKSPFEVGEKVVVPLLKKRGVHRLEAVLLTHGDQDHIGGMNAVLNEIPVKAVVFNGTMTDSSAFRELMQTALEKRIPVYAAGAGSAVWKLGKDTELAFLSPVLGEEGGIGHDLPLMKEQNHASLVFVLRMNGHRILFTGDTDAAAERNALLRLEERGAAGKEGAPSLFSGPIDVMKVAHHGSKTSTSAAWLSAWQPKASVISAGVNNMYGHPHPDVVARLERYGSAVFQTKLQGEIQMKLKEGSLEVRSKLPLPPFFEAAAGR